MVSRDTVHVSSQNSKKHRPFECLFDDLAIISDGVFSSC